MSASLRISHLEKSFPNGKRVIRDVSFDVAPGEIVALLGPSGCGKTTTLRSVAGLENPTGGVIEIDNRTVAAPAQKIMTPPQDRNIGMVFQSYAIWPHMTVAQNVSYPLRLRRNRRASSKSVETRLVEVLQLVGLLELRDRPATALSGGQMQRIALARSLIYEPALILFDEPLSNLDIKLRLRLRDELRTIVKAAGMTALYVTHDQEEAIAIGDRIGVMKDGELIQIASAADLYSKPANEFVADFTGATNILHGVLRERGEETGDIELADGSRLTARMIDPLAPGAAVTVRFRPQDAKLRPADGAGIPTQVVQSRFLGSTTSHTISIGGQQVEAVEAGTCVKSDKIGAMKLFLDPATTWSYAKTA
ncbi:MAG TPA: ABC transporter ATP-binding protein [Herbaspirillum sp.]|jgi:iron(III) transport system ATP-binding protein